MSSSLCVVKREADDSLVTFFTTKTRLITKIRLIIKYKETAIARKSKKSTKSKLDYTKADSRFQIARVFQDKKKSSSISDRTKKKLLQQRVGLPSVIQAP